MLLYSELDSLLANKHPGLVRLRTQPYSMVSFSFKELLSSSCCPPLQSVVQCPQHYKYPWPEPRDSQAKNRSAEKRKSFSQSKRLSQVVVKVNASDVGVAGSWGEVHTPQSSLTWGACLPSEIYVKEIREHNCPKLRRRDQGKEPWRRINVKSESLRVVMDRKTVKVCPERICSLTLNWGEKREVVKTEGWYSNLEGEKKTPQPSFQSIIIEIKWKDLESWATIKIYRCVSSTFSQVRC